MLILPSLALPYSPTGAPLPRVPRVLGVPGKLLGLEPGEDVHRRVVHHRKAALGHSAGDTGREKGTAKPVFKRRIPGRIRDAKGQNPADVIFRPPVAHQLKIDAVDSIVKKEKVAEVHVADRLYPPGRAVKGT